MRNLVTLRASLPTGSENLVLPSLLETQRFEIEMAFHATDTSYPLKWPPVYPRIFSPPESLTLARKKPDSIEPERTREATHDKNKLSKIKASSCMLVSEQLF